MMMSPSSTFTTAAAAASFVDADTTCVVADNQVTLQLDAGANPGAADLLWICE